MCGGDGGKSDARDGTISVRKPRRGGLFIEIAAHPMMFFVFRRRVVEKSAPTRLTALDFPAAPKITRARRRKTKRREGLVAASCYKQATPTGFWGRDG